MVVNILYLRHFNGSLHFLDHGYLPLLVHRYINNLIDILDLMDFLMTLHNFRYDDSLFHNFRQMGDLLVYDWLLSLNDSVDDLWFFDLNGLDLILDLRVDNSVVEFWNLQSPFLESNFRHFYRFLDHLRFRNFN